MKPFLKWVGGKTQIIDQVLEHFPIKINTYIEPFVGGGSVLLSVLSRKIQPTRIIATDINPNLIQVWKSVQSNPDTFYKEVTELWKQYDSKPDMEAKKAYYFEMRTLYNSIKDKPSIKTAALFVFMNKTGFRGMYRENSKGGMNIPFGNYKTTPNLPDLDYWKTVSKLIRRVHFECIDFQSCIRKFKPKKGDFIYCDPPYVPESITSFTAYTKNKVDRDFHTQFFDTLKNLHSKQVNIVMSNSAVPVVIDAFKGDMWHTEIIKCRRAINSKNPAATTNEVIVSNI